MKLHNLIAFGFIVMTLSCKTQEINDHTYESNNLKIEKLTDNSFVHISYLETKNFGKVPCNGMIVIDRNEAIVFDTPINDSVASELINWIQNTLDHKIKAIVVSHFHMDCLGGLGEFHKHNIPSYANSRTIELAKSNSTIIPQNGFIKYLELRVGNENIISEFLGEGHTKDNIICYSSGEKVLFGGCLIKSVGAGKGNLEDANVDEWSNTVAKVKTKYGASKFIIPGHGKVGDKKLLDYTIKLFNPK